MTITISHNTFNNLQIFSSDVSSAQYLTSNKPTHIIVKYLQGMDNVVMQFSACSEEYAKQFEEELNSPS
jgi:hypothetical protein